MMGNLVVKDNALIEASHRLSEIEQRLILLAILKARKHCDEVIELKGQELIIYADDYANTFHIGRDMAYVALKQAVVGLFEAKWGYKYINDKGNKVVRYERFTQSAMYVEGEGYVSFRFADAIVPMLVELGKRFTVYEIEQVANLSSRYAMRLYEMIMQYFNKDEGKGVLKISLDELRFRLCLLDSEYKLMSDLKKRVIDLSVEQINKETDLIVTYEQRKQGRKIVGFDFMSKYKPEAKKAKKTEKAKQKENENRDPNTKDIFDGLTDQEREIVAQKNAYADQKGITDPIHRHNLINQGLEQHRQAVQAEQAQKEREKAERQAKKLAKQKREEQKKLEQEKELQRQANLIATFESLPIDEQERVLDKVGEMVGGLFEPQFNEARDKKTAHKEVRFMAFFYEILGV